MGKVMTAMSAKFIPTGRTWLTWATEHFWDVRLAHKLWIGGLKTVGGIAAVTLGVDMLGYSGLWTSVVSTPIIFVADWLLTRRYMLRER